MYGGLVYPGVFSALLFPSFFLRVRHHLVRALRLFLRLLLLVGPNTKKEHSWQGGGNAGLLANIRGPS